jgi:hypothetical protein
MRGRRDAGSRWAGCLRNSVEVTFMKVTSSRHFSHNNLKIVLVLFCLITTAARAKDPSWIHAHSFGGTSD